MSDLRISQDPFARPFELVTPISTVVFSDGLPADFIETPTTTSISPELIAYVERLGDQCKGFFGDRRPAWERGK